MELSKEIVREQLFPLLRGNDVWAGQLAHPNPFVDRMTLRPTSPSWLFSLIFVKAPDDQHEVVVKRLNTLIGVSSDRIVPRVYQITGEFDYLIPAYAASERARQDLEAGLSQAPIGALTSSIDCRLPHARAYPRLPLSEFEQAATRALFHNSMQCGTFWDDQNERLVTEMRNRARRVRGRSAELAQTCAPRSVSVLEAEGGHLRWTVHAVEERE